MKERMMRRPYVIMNAAMTLDGKIATKEGDSKISCPEDLDRVHRLRAEVDAIMVGAGTVLSDDPSLTVRRAKGKNPLRVVVDGRASIPPTARILDRSSPTLVAVSERAPEARVRELRRRGAEVIRKGREKVDLPRLLEELGKRGIRKILLEGGSTLNWYMLSSGLVDEIRVAVSPMIVGGEKAKTLVGGEGFGRVEEGIRLELKKVSKVGKDLLLVYKVKALRRGIKGK
ncbi:MAG: 2,5-diamino-6-(ribosylamino)-4(3H)-pyrimidinone 5'-phosphate reductase [Candidatus Hadarchaeales archaeon]